MGPVPQEEVSLQSGSLLVKWRQWRCDDELAGKSVASGTQMVLDKYWQLAVHVPFPVMILDTTHPNPVTLQTEDTRPLAESSGLVTRCHVAYSQSAEPQRAGGTCPCSQILDAHLPCAALLLVSKALLSLCLIHLATSPTPFMN